MVADDGLKPDETSGNPPPPPPPEPELFDRQGILGLGKKPRVIKLVEIPEANAKVHVRALTTTERDNLEATFVKTGKGGRQKLDTKDMRAKTIQAGTVKPDGTLMFTVGDIPEIGRLPAIISDRIYDEIQKLSRLDRDALDDEEKNSGDGQRDGS